MTDTRFLAVDWGTTNCRAWVVGPDGRVEAGEDFALGVSKLQPGEAQARFEDTVRPALNAERLPAILCGMIGSNLGWELVPYFDCPADLATLAKGLRRVGDQPPAWIVPGVRAVRPDGGPDVMRGEEVQILGWAAEAPERSVGAHLICHPGTHTKWVRLVDGRIERFVTAMSGELFDILRKHSVVKGPEGPDDPAAFEAGLAAAGDGSALASRLFTTRSRVVGGDMPASAANSYLSGVLVGADVAATPRLLGAEGEPVALIGDARLCGLYECALAKAGIAVTTHDGDAAALAGLSALYRTEFVR
jgi:2-dehydro-3-deoxygalactonokinase